MVLGKSVYTYEDIVRLPDDGQRYEVIEGELIVVPAPTTGHQGAVWQLAALLHRAQEAGYGKGFVAPLDVVFGPHDATQPDLFFIRRERLGIVTRANVQGVPDLIIEVLSPGTRADYLGRKFRLYARCGVPYYWVVDPDARTVQPFTLREGSYVEEPILRAGQELACPLFPGITTDVAAIFD